MAEIAVIGAGATGLSAAFRLRRAGHRVTVFEAGDRVGGKMTTTLREGYLFEDGPSFISRGYTAILRLVADAGLTDELVTANGAFGFLRDGHIHDLDSARPVRALFEPIVSARSKLAMTKVLREVIRHRRALADQDMTALVRFDTESVGDYVRRTLNQEILEHFVSPALRTTIGSGVDELSAADLFYCFSNFVGRPGFVAFRNGMSSFAEALAADLDVVLSAPVHAVRDTGSTVELEWSDALGNPHRRDFDGTVVTLSAHATAGLLPDLDQWRRQFLRGVEYNAMLVAVAAVSTPPPVRAAFVPVSEVANERVLALSFEHNKAPGRVPDGKGIVGVYAAPKWSRELYDVDEDHVVKHMFDEADALLPGVADNIEFTRLNRWDPVAIRSRPGYWTRLAEFVRIAERADTRVQLAGDYFCTSNLNSATTAGERAAGRLHAALSAGRG